MTFYPIHMYYYTEIAGKVLLAIFVLLPYDRRDTNWVIVNKIKKSLRLFAPSPFSARSQEQRHKKIAKTGASAKT